MANDEIMVDEYQDTSDIQEEFINLISNNNVYMVGDIKQSIYRFRNANPYIFKDKYDRYSLILIPFILIVPLLLSKYLSNKLNNVDLPWPDLPTIAIFFVELDFLVDLFSPKRLSGAHKNISRFRKNIQLLLEKSRQNCYHTHSK